MKLVALISGGKDSLFNMLQCIAAGHDIVAIGNIEPEQKEELDSYMYQSVGHQVISLIAAALGLPIYRQKTKGKALWKGKIYKETEKDEVEDLLQLIQKVKKDIHIEGVSVGAIASDYQRTRVENVCRRLNLRCFAYLWRRDQTELLQEMIDADVYAIIIKVACIGLHPDKHLGMNIKDIKSHLLDLNRKYGMNVCGEGGEYETLTIDCPLFHSSINIIDSESLILSNDAFAPVAFLNVKNAVLKTKVWETNDPVESLQARLAHVKSVVKDPYYYIEDCVDEISSNIFPQHQKLVSDNALPSPFELERPSNPEISNISEYWKTTSLTSYSLSPKGTSSTVLGVDSATYNFNYSTGWCCIGNVTGTTAQEALLCLQRHLSRANYDFQDLVCVNLFVRDMTEFNALNKIYSNYISDFLPPCRICVETQLHADVSVLLAAVAHKVISRSQKVLTLNSIPSKEVMYVQSISHWAPANIGPYSQCIEVGGIYYLAGQIPLIPGTMEILNKPILHQCKLTLRHVLRVLQAMNDSLSFSNVLQAICYVTSESIAHDVISLWSYITNNETSSLAVIVVSGLPKNAQLEWEIVACSYQNPQVDERNETVHDFSLDIKRCIYFEPYTSSFVCNVSSSKEILNNRKGVKLSSEKIALILQHCLQYIRNEVKNIGLHLCMIKLFYLSNDVMKTIISDFSLSYTFEHKVVVTAIPVVACQESSIFLSIAGLCH